MSSESESKRDFAQEFYWRMREAASGRRIGRDQRRIQERTAKATSKPFDKGRDPVTAMSTLDSLIENFRWTGEMAEADLHVRWSEVVGADTAANSMPEDIVNGTLTIRCSSTAWATQLRLMSPQLLEIINERYAGLAIDTIKTLGPDAPSWKKGPRSVPGRGPRDTYG
jgi:predicted nucleic acid-binding Zn ribbon protein